MSKKDKISEEVTKAEEKVGASVLGVFQLDRTNQKKLVRTYSAEMHGLSFKDSAEQFAKKIGGTVEKFS